jgi:hypothetical protein
MDADELAAVVGREAAKELNHSLSKMKHCLGQLSDDQVWWRSHPAMNSIGNLILHLCGNVRQWIIGGLGAGPDIRNRPAEFSERGPISKEQLLRRLDAVVNEAKSVLERQTAAQLVEPRRIQGSIVTGLQAIFDSVPHFQGHAQEIIHMTRLQLGDGYRVFWQPKSPEEGAPP